MIGIDLISVPRMERLLKKFGKKALLRFLCEKEIELVKNGTTASGFWAAKEAFSKALGTGIGADCSFHDIKIYKDKQGAPKIALSRRIIQKFDITQVALSITHDGEFAIAVVTLETSTSADKVKEF
ncbi:holo-ACP synthase [Sulfurimonas paralvinellae]|uniref:Holo-[acyl-carrier-protein] synthase n=1 Tax=Sulfurimonas paralvinellae TaxID=317658 RepID=A0A7M1B8S6_9BACT|nr:holo-ACP synthase [Sulfurimonas paralvinellae]QOP46021.1 holo-ACP synthase [Sulfurimonas paralvinellae]